MALEAKEGEPMKRWTNHEARMLAFALAIFACADDQNATTPAEVTSTTDPGTATASTTMSTGPGASTGTNGTGTALGLDDLAPWHGTWYALDSQFMVNEPMWWGDGGDALTFTLFELRSNSVKIQVNSCIWGGAEYEYTLLETDDGIILDPVDGEHKFRPNGEIEQLYLAPGIDCDILVVREIQKTGEEGELFSWTEGLKRGELCLMCAPTQGMQGVISDCGTPVPWECPG